MSKEGLRQVETGARGVYRPCRLRLSSGTHGMYKLCNGVCVGIQWPSLLNGTTQRG